MAGLSGARKQHPSAAQLAARGPLERERLAATRLVRLQALTAALSEAVTPRDVARVAVEHARSALAAREAGAWAIREDGGVELLHEIGPALERRVRLAMVSGDTPTPVGDALREREPVWVLSRAELDERYPGLFPPSSGVEAVVCLPMQAKGRCVGAMSLSFDAAVELTGPDRAFLLVVAQYGAQALERARLYDAERKARAEAVAAVRARDEVVAVVSHDLKNPLNAILMSSALLRRSAEDPEHVRRHADAIERSVGRMRNLVRDLLDLARVEAGHLVLDRRATDVPALAAEAVSALQPIAAAKGLSLTCATGLARGVRADCDRERVMQVLSNLLGNAIAFTPSGGCVILRARPDGAELEIAVSDTGPGIPPGDQSHVFERFWRSGPGQGTGLGLSIARSVVEAHGGRIWVESRRGEGATFLFTLPVAT